MTTYTVTLDVDDERLRVLAEDIITTAVEGGINYWASVSEYRWGSGPTTVTIHAHDPNDHTGPLTITAKEMLQAVGDLLEGRVKVFHTAGYSQTFRERLIESFSARNESDLDFDASDADCMMQLACFGEVVYG